MKKFLTCDKDNHWSYNITNLASFLLILMFCLQMSWLRILSTEFLQKELTKASLLLSSWELLSLGTCEVWFFFSSYRLSRYSTSSLLLMPFFFLFYCLAYLILAIVWRREIRLIIYVYLFGKAFNLCMYWEINPEKFKSQAYFTWLLADLFRCLFCLTDLSTNFASGVRLANFVPSSCSYFPLFWIFRYSGPNFILSQCH